MGPRKHTKYHHPAMVAQLRDPPGKPLKIMKFQACLQATKSHQNWSQSHRKPCKNDTKIDIIPTYVKSWFLQYFLHQILDSGAPDTQSRTPKSLKNVTCKHACQKTQLLFKSWPKTSKWRPRNPSKIDRNPSLDPKVPLRVLPSPPASLDGPQGAKLDATSMPNDTFWAPNLTESAPTFSVNLKTRDVETASRHQRASIHFSRDIPKSIQRTTS